MHLSSFARPTLKATTEVEQIVSNSLTHIKDAVNNLELKNYQSLFKNIVFNGFPDTLRREIDRSQRHLKKRSPQLLRYAPHAALASALCLFAAQKSDAAWLWGQINQQEKGYGCAIFINAKGESCGGGMGEFVDVCLNPFVCFISSNCCSMPCWKAFGQLPKYIILYGYIGYRYIFGEEFAEKRKGRKTVKLWREKEEAEQIEIEKLKQLRREDMKRTFDEVEIKKANNEFIQKATEELRSIEDSIKNNPILGIKANHYYIQILDSEKLMTNYQKVIETFFHKKGIQVYSSSLELKNLIGDMTKEAEKVRDRLEETNLACVKAKGILNDVTMSLKSSNRPPLIKELEFDTERINIDDLKSLLYDKRWDDFKQVIEFLMEDLNRLKSLTSKPN